MDRTIKNLMTVSTNIITLFVGFVVIIIIIRFTQVSHTQFLCSFKHLNIEEVLHLIRFNFCEFFVFFINSIQNHFYEIGNEQNAMVFIIVNVFFISC